MGLTAKDREMSTHAYDPSGCGSIYLNLMLKVVTPFSSEVIVEAEKVFLLVGFRTGICPVKLCTNTFVRKIKGQEDQLTQVYQENGH